MSPIPVTSSAVATFSIDKTVARPLSNEIDVWVSYDGGMKVFTFPASYPNSTMLTHIRLELRKVDVDVTIAKRMKELRGKKYEL